MSTLVIQCLCGTILHRIEGDVIEQVVKTVGQCCAGAFGVARAYRPPEVRDGRARVRSAEIG
jgi:hypothetical protein